MTEADLNHTFRFAFGPFSGLNSIENGQPGTEFPIHFSNPYCELASPNGANYTSANKSGLQRHDTDEPEWRGG